MVFLAQSSPGCRSTRSPQIKKATVMLGRLMNPGIPTYCTRLQRDAHKGTPSERGKAVSKFVQCRSLRLRAGASYQRRLTSARRGAVTSSSDAGTVASRPSDGAGPPPASYPTARRDPCTVRCAPWQAVREVCRRSKTIQDPNADPRPRPDARCKLRGNGLLFLLGGAVARVTSLFAPCAPLLASLCAPRAPFLTSFCAPRASFLAPLRTRLRRLCRGRGGRGGGLGSSR